MTTVAALEEPEVETYRTELGATRELSGLAPAHSSRFDGCPALRGHSLRNPETLQDTAGMIPFDRAAGSSRLEPGPGRLAS